MSLKKLLAGLATVLAVAAGSTAAVAETSEVRISKGYGILYLPLMVMQEKQLLEKHAKEAGLGDVKASWPTLDGGNVINDAMLSGQLDIAAIGVPGFLTLWSKAKGNPKLEIAGLSGLSSTSLYLNTRNPNVKSLTDFTEKDRIALPGIKTSLSAVVLQMAVAQQFGVDNYAKLDPLTVSLPHPDAYVALQSGKSEVNSHFGSPPFSYMELDISGVHRVLNSADVLGDISLDMVYTTTRFRTANPKISAAFIAALDEAASFIAKDKRAAAELYIRAAHIKASADDVLKMLNDPQTKFTATPEGIMKFASFMHRAGTIKNQPANWKDLFFPEIHARPGS